ncbi:cytochrome P450 [Flagelloscypha sp. PMI_526]|nr:cytochrome P450 [Flagelloscypha sp. PMI_526]
MEGISLGTVSLGVVAVYGIRRYFIIHHILIDIPTVGSSGFFSTYWGIFDHLKNANGLLEQGYHRYPDSVFKIYTSLGWQLYAGGHARLADAKKAADDELSAQFGINDAFQAEFTMGPEVAWDPNHSIAAIRGPLTRNIAKIYPEMREETIASATDHIPLTEDWTEVPVVDVLMRMVSRISNRVFVGLPLCHNQELLDINVKYSMQVITSAVLLRMFPKFLRPFAAKIVCTTQGSYRRLRNILEPMLQERLDNDEQFGKSYVGRPNDLVSWLLEFAQGSQRSIRDLCIRILGANFAALHTTTVTVTHALFDLATNPQYIGPLREEIEKITNEHGWSKASLQKMKKLDSLMKESTRMWGVLAANSSRLVMKTFTFSNGQVVPPGYILTFTARAIHRDEANFEDPNDFRPFRFSEMRDKEGQEVFHSFVTLDPDFVPFGIPNRHACPGRFFAATEIKGILAHLIMTYDFKFEDGQRPKNIEIAEAISPSPKARLLFRKRKP